MGPTLLDGFSRHWNYWMKCCLVSSEHWWCQLTYRGLKLSPMPKHGSINVYVHGNQKAGITRLLWIADSLFGCVWKSAGGRPGPGSPSALNSRPYGLSVCTATQNELHFNVTLIVREQSQEPFPFPPRPSYYTPGPFLQHVCTMWK